MLAVKHSLQNLKFFGRIRTLKTPYLVLIDETGAKTTFLVSSDLVNFEILPVVDARVIAALEELNFGICCREPFFGKLNKKLPKEPVEEA